MGFDQNQKTTALSFARALANRDYTLAYGFCSRQLREQSSAELLGQMFEEIVPPDWGDIDPVELVENAEFPFIYIVLGGDIYSEAIIISSFEYDNGQVKIASFELGRP